MIHRLQGEAGDGRDYGILVVDDESLVRRVTVRLLQAAGFRTYEAEDGPRALEILDRQGVHAVILDWSMPGMSGEATFRAIRAVCPDLPITVATGWSADDARRKLAEYGRVDVLQKPFDTATLALTVRGQIEASLTAG